jgi:hypothetical protein
MEKLVVYGKRMARPEKVGGWDQRVKRLKNFEKTKSQCQAKKEARDKSCFVHARTLPFIHSALS